MILCGRVYRSTLRRASANCQLPIDGPRTWRWRAGLRPHHFAWLGTHPVARSLTGHPDPIASRLLLSAADVLDGSEALDVLFRRQLTDLLATRLLATRTGSPTTFQPTLGGLSPRCATLSNVCARTPMRTSPSRLWLRTPACRIS